MSKNLYIEYLVVGNGPSATHFASRMVEHKQQIVLVDSSDPKEKSNIFRFNPINTSVRNTWKYLQFNHNKCEFPSPPKNFFNFIHFGKGGLSARWGSGCSKLTNLDIGFSKEIFNKIKRYYPIVEKKIGIYYEKDNLKDYLGSFNASKVKLKHPPSLSSLMKSKNSSSVTFGAARKAIITKKMKGRSACNECGGCNIHCFGKSIYSSEFDLENGKIKLFSGYRVSAFEKSGAFYKVFLHDSDCKVLEIRVKYLILAAGTMSTANLVSKYLISSLNLKNIKLNVLFNPLVRLLIVNMKKEKNDSFIAGGIVARIKVDKKSNAYASIVSGVSIPTSDFLTFVPCANKVFRNLIEHFKKFISVSLIFFPSSYIKSNILISNRSIIIEHQSNGLRLSILSAMYNYYIALLKDFKLPIFFSYQKNGSDLHHGGTFPVGKRANFNVSEHCELNGHPNLFLIDGSWVRKVPEKPMTFTLIANSYRIADYLSRKIL
jgi:hypothetical protein